MIVGVDASGEELQGKVCPFSSIFTLLVFQNLGLKLKFATIFGRWNRSREMFRRATHLVLPR